MSTACFAHRASSWVTWAGSLGPGRVCQRPPLPPLWPGPGPSPAGAPGSTAGWRGGRWGPGALHCTGAGGREAPGQGRTPVSRPGCRGGRSPGGGTPQTPGQPGAGIGWRRGPSQMEVQRKLIQTFFYVFLFDSDFWPIREWPYAEDWTLPTSSKLDSGH